MKVYPNLTAEEYVTFWKEKYLKCPKGFVSWVADADGEIVGHYGALVASATLSGKSILVSQAVDAFTHPQWRRQGIFVGLGSKLLDDLGTRGAHLTYGIPNKAAMPGHMKLSWVVAAKIPRYVRIVDRDRALSAYKGSKSKAIALRLASSMLSSRRRKTAPLEVHAREAREALSEVERLWRESAGRYQFSIDRSADYLAWRYPAESARRYAVLAGEEKGRVIVASVCGIAPSGIGQVAELFVEGERLNEAGTILGRTVSHLKSVGSHTVEGIASARFLERVFRSEGFIKVSHVPMIAHANDEEGRRQVDSLLQAREMLLSLGDSDLA